MVSGQFVFRYKIIKSPLHKVPALVKLIVLLAVSLLCFLFSPLWLLAGIIIIIITASICGFTLHEQFTDFKPALFYAAILFLFSVFSNIISSTSSYNDFFRTALRLIFIVQLSALVFRTTSPLEIRDTVRLDIIAFFVSFIPEIFKTWSSLNLAWKARGGRQGLHKIKTLSFVLISISFEKAAVKAKALEARR